MRTRPTCGAHVVDLEWCSQCYSVLPAAPTWASTAVVEALPKPSPAAGPLEHRTARREDRAGVLAMAGRRHQLRVGRTNPAHARAIMMMIVGYPHQLT